eukprot:15367203-Ditylum_brightwellii.AAC.3
MALLHHCQLLVLPTAPAITPNQRKSTTNVEILISMYTCTSHDGISVPESYLWHHIDWEGGGKDVGGAMVQQKGESWGLTGNTNFYPLKPMQWIQRWQHLLCVAGSILTQ